MEDEEPYDDEPPFEPLEVDELGKVLVSQNYQYVIRAFTIVYACRRQPLLQIILQKKRQHLHLHEHYINTCRRHCLVWEYRPVGRGKP